MTGSQRVTKPVEQFFLGFESAEKKDKRIGLQIAELHKTSLQMRPLQAQKINNSFCRN